MIPPAFGYEKPSSLEEAVASLARHGSDARVLAGGQSLLTLLKARSVAPRVVVDIGGLDELRGVEADDDSVTIGALTTQAELLESPAIGDRLPHLGADASLLGDPVVRNCGTFAGALAFAHPGADWTALALVLEVRVRVRGATGERTIAIQDFLLDAFTTALGPTELITHLTSAIPAGDLTLVYRKVRHPGSGFALAGVAVLLERDADGRYGECRVAITGAGRRAVRATAVEGVLQAERLSPEAIEHATNHATDELDLMSDLYANAEYRERLARTCVRRALLDGFGRAG